MNMISSFTFALAFGCVSIGYAQDSATHSGDPEMAAIQRQNAVLEQRIKLLTQRNQLDSLNNPEPVTLQNQILEQRLRLAVQERNLMKLAGPREEALSKLDANLQLKDDTPIESVRFAYTSLTGLAPDVAKALSCSGKNVVLYGPSQSDALFSLKTFNDQVELLRGRLKTVLDIQPPSPPDKDSTNGVYGVAALSGPVLQSVLDLIALFRNAPLAAAELSPDEKGLVAIIANAAIAQGCVIYWPDQYTANPFNSNSLVMASLQSVADVNDNGGKTGKTAGLQQRLQSLRVELSRSQNLTQARAQAVEKEQSKLSEASKKVDAIKTQIDFIAGHIKDQKNSALQDKLNKAFDKSWDELDQAIRRQIGSHLPGTIEEQGKLGEMSKRLDLLKTRTDWLSQYVKDEKDIALQDKLKRSLSSTWDQLDAAIKNLQSVTVSVPLATDPDEQERKRWEKYSAELKELITTVTAASEAYTTFRGALLDGSSGAAPLTRMLRAEALRDLMFDDKLQERSGSSIVQLKLQKLTGTQLTKLGSEDKKTFSGGVVLSFVQYDPNGKVKNSGVHTAYIPFK